jgi:hypothetical protein
LFFEQLDHLRADAVVRSSTYRRALKKSKAVGAHFGLTRRKHQSGEMDRPGRSRRAAIASSGSRIGVDAERSAIATV